MITCRGKPILIRKRDERGRYRIPLMQTRGQWQPRKPSKKSKKFLQEANIVYHFPTKEKSAKWMHTVCGYPVKSTWIKAIKAGNFTGLPMLNKRNVAKYYPETAETPKGHLNQSRKKVRSTMPKTKPLEKTDTTTLQGKKVRKIYTKVYSVCNTVFSDQTGQFPTISKQGNKYIMVMVGIDSNAILVDPLKNCMDAEPIKSYRDMML